MKTLVELIVIVLSLATICVTIKCCKQEPETIIVTKSDTVVVVEYDTLRYKYPVLVDRVKTDTFYVMVNADSVKKDTQNNAYYVELEREQLHYSEQGVYDAWISGFKPRMDSFYVYPKTYTKTIEKLVRSEKTNVFANCEFGMNKREPFVGVGITATKKQYLFGGVIGVGQNGVYYGLKIGFKINGE